MKDYKDTPEYKAGLRAGYKSGLAAGADAGYNAARAEIFKALRDTLNRADARAADMRRDNGLEDTPHARYVTGQIRGIEQTTQAIWWRLNTLGVTGND